MIRKMPLKSVTVSQTVSIGPQWTVRKRAHYLNFQLLPYSPCTIRACSHSTDDTNNVYKQLGLFSLRKRIEDAIVRAELMAPMALELEEARKIEQEELMRKYNLWEDLAKSNECLISLADSTKLVDALKDLKYKCMQAEEAKLITQLAEMDAIDYQLFKQAYNASVDVSKFLDQYEMSKLLSGPYDMEGACIIIKAQSEGVNSEAWADDILKMYMMWAEKLGCKGRIVEKSPSVDGRTESAIIEFESKYAFGYLCGERGLHRMIKNSLDGSHFCETSLVSVDVIPVFLETVPNLQLDDEDLEVSDVHDSDRSLGQSTEHAVHICHIPTGITVHYSGERSQFLNKMKALNRLKAKLLIIAMEQGVSSIKEIKKAAIMDIWQQDVRRYIFNPYKLVQDVKTAMQLPDLTSVLNGNLEPLIRAHISSRQAKCTRDR